MRAYGLGLEVRGGRLDLESWSGFPRQHFRYLEDGSIRPEGADECLAVGAGVGSKRAE